MTGDNGADIANADQAEYWRGPVGQKWVDNQEWLDTTFGPVIDPLLAHARPAAGERVLDIGCGAGASSIVLAERVGPEGHVLAVDISDVLLARAAARIPERLKPRLAFLNADAQTYPFEADRDLVASRFGVMFFEDPVAAFANIRTALRPGGRLCVTAWAPIERNPWAEIPRQAVIDRLGPPPPSDPRAPGPLAFADTGYVTGILRDAGYADTRAHVVPITLTPPGDRAAVAQVFCKVGFGARLMHTLGATEDDERAIAETIFRKLQPYGEETIRLPAVINLYSARQA